MALIHERAFRVRQYECDAYGHVNHANYLRYMQETAFDASAAAGYDLDRYREIERAWLVRETDITYQQPLVYGDSVIVKTWVLDFRRVRSRRAYEMRHATSGELVAQATTDWVFLNDQTGRPETVPQEMIDGFFPDGPPDDVPPRERFPKAPAAAAGRLHHAPAGAVERHRPPPTRQQRQLHGLRGRCRGPGLRGPRLAHDPYDGGRLSASWPGATASNTSNRPSLAMS